MISQRRPPQRWKNLLASVLLALSLLVAAIATSRSAHQSSQQTMAMFSTSSSLWDRQSTVGGLSNRGGGGGGGGGGGDFIKDCNQELGAGNCQDSIGQTFDYCEHTTLTDRTTCLQQAEDIPESIGVVFRIVEDGCQILFDDLPMGTDFSTLCPATFLADVTSARIGQGEPTNRDSDPNVSCFICQQLPAR